jgi:hypothetical protein
MILKYRGSNVDWVLEEADVISYKDINIEAVRTRIKKEEGYRNLATSDEAHQYLFECLVQFIKNETAGPDDITFHGIIDIQDGKNFIAVVLDGAHIRVFDASATVYVLNSSGKTIQKL